MTTIVSVRRKGHVVIGGDGQATLGNTVMKGNVRKVRRLYNDKVIAGFAGGTADAFKMSEMTPRESVSELDGYIVGQHNAKRAVAIALRNRWRRMQLDEALRHEVTPKNILMIGPTGVGKTEIARRLAKLATEVGYVGKEVDSIIRDLTDAAVKMVRLLSIEQSRFRAEELAEERVLDVLIPPAKNNWGQPEESGKRSSARQNFRKKLREGQLDEKEIEINLAAAPMGVEIMAPPGMEEMTNQLQSMFKNLAGQKQKPRKIKIKEAMKLLVEEEAAKLVNPEELKEKAIEAVEQHGIVFIAEIDKICKRGEVSGPDVSPGKVCSAICCRWWKVAPFLPSTGW